MLKCIRSVTLALNNRIGRVILFGGSGTPHSLSLVQVSGPFDEMSTGSEPADHAYKWPQSHALRCIKRPFRVALLNLVRLTVC